MPRVPCSPAMAPYARSAGIKCGLRDGLPIDGKQESCIGMNGCCYCGPCCGPCGPCCGPCGPSWC